MFFRRALQGIQLHLHLDLRLDPVPEKSLSSLNWLQKELLNPGPGSAPLPSWLA